jgi:hypothetical protein
MIDQEKLLNRPLDSVVLEKNGELITFYFLDGSAESFAVEGDCCSHSWIEHLEMPNDVKGASITEISETQESNDKLSHTEGYEEVVNYYTKFSTQAGDIVLEYRNDSNGYYGGYLVRA